MDDYGIMLLRKEIRELERNLELGYDEFSLDALEAAYNELCELEKEGIPVMEKQTTESNNKRTYALTLNAQTDSEIEIGDLFRVVGFEDVLDLHFGRVICAKLERIERNPRQKFHFLEYNVKHHKKGVV